MKYRGFVIMSLLSLCFVMSSIAVGFAAEGKPIGDCDQVIEECTAAIERNPYDAVSYYRRADAYFAEKKYDLALKDYNRVIAEAYLDRGYLYEKQGDDQKAIEHYSLSIDNDPTFEMAYDHRGFMYNKIGRYDLALIDCSKAVEINPNFVAGYLNQGNAYEKLHMYQEAIAAYRNVLDLLPEGNPHRNRAMKRIEALGGSI